MENIMKKLIILATVSALSFSAYAVAQTPAELSAQFKNLQERVQAMSPAERSAFKQMMRANMQNMSAEERQLFKTNMRQAKGEHCDHSDKHDWWDKARHKMSHAFDKDRGDCQHDHGKGHHHDKEHKGKYCDHK